MQAKAEIQWPKSPELKIFNAIRRKEYPAREHNRWIYYHGGVDVTVKAKTLKEAKELVKKHGSQTDAWKVWWHRPTALRINGGLLRIDEKIFPITKAVQKIIDDLKAPKRILNLGDSVQKAAFELIRVTSRYKNYRDGGNQVTGFGSTLNGICHRHMCTDLGSAINPARYALIKAIMEAKGLLKDRWIPDNKD